MRKFLMAAVMVFASCFAASAGEGGVGEMIRVPLLDGIYSVEAPEEWHLELSGEDFTATFSEQPGADGTLVIAPPNPVVDDVKDFTKMSIQGLFNAFDNGKITDENDKNIGKFPAYTAMFEFMVADSPFVGWARTIEMDGFAVQAMAVVSAGKYVKFMETAGAIADSYVLDVDEAESLLPQLKRIGRRAYDELEKNAAKKDKKDDGKKKDDKKEEKKKDDDKAAKKEEK